MSLPIVGIGPIYGCLIFGTTTSLAYHPIMVIDNRVVGFLLSALGVVFAIYGIMLWGRAIFIDKMVYNISNNNMLCSGSYSIVRHPVYSGILDLCTGILLIINSCFGFVLFISFAFFLSNLLKFSEERWLIKLYGDKYLNYQKKVPQIIPKFNKLF